MIILQMYESLQAKIDELEKSNEALKSQVLEKDKYCMQLRQLVKQNTVGVQEVRNLTIKIPGEKEGGSNATLENLALISSDMNFEIEYLKKIDELRIKSIAIDELRNVLDSERTSRVLAIKRATEGSIAKDVQIQNLQIALEDACKRTCELEDRIAKSKQRLITHVGSSPILSTSTPRLSMGSIHPDNIQRTSFSGTVPSIPSQRLSVNMTSAMLPKVPFPSYLPQATYSHVPYPHGGQ
jgi:hypothetical protein